MGRHETVNTRSEHYSPRVTGSIPVRNTNSSRTGRMSYCRETSFTSNNTLYALFLDSNMEADEGADKGDDR